MPATALIGCDPVRPPDDVGNFTVVARVLPKDRPRGYGETLFVDAMKTARGLGGATLETIVLELKFDGLRFDLGYAFVEVSRHISPEDREPLNDVAAYETLAIVQRRPSAAVVMPLIDSALIVEIEAQAIVPQNDDSTVPRGSLPVSSRNSGGWLGF
jgi:hypothetical protein